MRTSAWSLPLPLSFGFCSFTARFVWEDNSDGSYDWSFVLAFHGVAGVPVRIAFTFSGRARVWCMMGNGAV
ncbi:hypothetical protein BDN67DRAFT_973644 [Paxillus ammoniavirescens]|nr:hypothetical protein BDN67DRAFT_973644 [Paxillus ammoniavirescens]